MSLKCILQGQDSKNLATKEELNQHIENKSNPHEVTIEQIGAASSGKGYGELLITIGGDNISDTDFINLLEAKLSVMEWNEAIQVQWSNHPTVSGVTYIGTLWKFGTYAVLTGISYDGTIYIRRKLNGNWQSWETLVNEKAISNILLEIQSLSRENLFVNPLLQIWQKNPTGWTGVPVNRYICDNWRILSSNDNNPNTFTPASPYGIKNAAGANCTITQFLENAAQFNGLQMTCSVLKILADGTQNFVTATKTASGWTDSTDILAFFGTSSGWRWIGAGETFVGAKLEVGTNQTFAHKDSNGNWILNEVPEISKELLRCQRYYQIFKVDSAAIPIGVGSCYTVNSVVHDFPLKAPMRANPTVSLSGGPFYLRQGNPDPFYSSEVVNYGFNGNMVQLYITNLKQASSGQLTPGYACDIYLSDKDSALEFSANL